MNAKKAKKLRRAVREHFGDRIPERGYTQVRGKQIVDHIGPDAKVLCTTVTLANEPLTLRATYRKMKAEHGR